MVKQPCVRWRGRMMEFIHDHNIESLRIEVLEIQIGQRLDGAEHMCPVDRPPAAGVLLSERCIVEYLAEGGPALRQDLIAMRDEQQRIVPRITKPTVVQSRYDSFAGACRHNDEVAPMTVHLTFSGEFCEDLALITVRADVEWCDLYNNVALGASVTFLG